MVINQSLLNVSISFERRLPRYWWSPGITYYLPYKRGCLRSWLKIIFVLAAMAFDVAMGPWCYQQCKVVDDKILGEISTWNLTRSRWGTLKYFPDPRKWLGDSADWDPSLVQKMFEIFPLRTNNRAKEPRRGRWWPAGWSEAEIIDDEDDCSDRSG